MVTAEPDVGKVVGVTNAMTGATSGGGGAACVAACVAASSSNGSSRNSPIGGKGRDDLLRQLTRYWDFRQQTAR